MKVLTCRGILSRQVDCIMWAMFISGSGFICVTNSVPNY